MLSDDDFLLNIPRNLPAKQRVILEGIGFAMSCLRLSYEVLIQTLSRYHRDDLDRMPRSERFQCFLHAWSFINQAHLLRELTIQFKKTVDKGFEVSALEDFIKDSESVKVIRDKINHIPEQVSNLAKKKGNLSPMTGVLSYCLFDYKKDDPKLPMDDQPITLHVVSMRAGSMTHDTIEWPIDNPLGNAITFPVDALQFIAFNTDLKSLVRLTKIYQDTDKLRMYFNTVIRASCLQSAAQIAALEGHDLKTIMKPQDAEWNSIVTVGPIQRTA